MTLRVSPKALRALASGEAPIALSTLARIAAQLGLDAAPYGAQPEAK
jgi:hypothetical protein